LIYVLALYAVTSLAAFVSYGLDKRAARLGRPRVPEARLHALEFMGGWPGALVAQSVFRHKRRKTSFMLVFWGIVLLHAAAWIAWLGARAGWWFEARP
jgi:uncharacterized membrane protein YsdA (DUF1294 family)